MTSFQDSTLVVIGSGPGIGSAVAAIFAQEGFDKIALLSRNATRLEQDRQAVEEAAQAANRDVSVGTWAVDITDTAAYQDVLGRVSSFGTLECILFNAARVKTSDLMEEPVEELEYDFKVSSRAPAYPLRVPVVLAFGVTYQQRWHKLTPLRSPTQHF